MPAARSAATRLTPGSQMPARRPQAKKQCSAPTSRTRSTSGPVPASACPRTGRPERSRCGTWCPASASPASTRASPAGRRTCSSRPGTLAAMAATAPPGAVLPEGRVLVSNEGGVFDSTAPSDAVILEMQIRTAGLGPIEFTDEKQQTLEFADRQGDNFARLFGLIGSFTVVAGVLLLINIFVMLAEERKSELGTLRALGFTRRHLVRVFGLEGTAYSVAAAALGALAGIGVGRVVVRATEGIFSQGERGIVGLKFAVTPASLFAGFAIGLAIALITVWGTSVRISRLNIIRAIRDTPEPPHQAKPGDLRRDAAGVVLGAAIFVVGVGWQQPVAALLGPVPHGAVSGPVAR